VPRLSSNHAATKNTASFSVRNDWLADSATLLEETLHAMITIKREARIDDLVVTFDDSVPTHLLNQLADEFGKTASSGTKGDR